MYSLLYSVYSFPNMILPIFSGLILIKIGKGNTMMLLQTLIVLGNAIIILGPFLEYYPFMVIGRSIFGMGSETAMIIQTIFVTDWFIGQELQFAMAMAGSIPNFFSFMGGAMAPYVFK